MHKKKYLLFCLLLIILLTVHFRAFYINAFASSTKKEDLKEVTISGNEVVENYTYYLEWSNLDVTYNGKNNFPSAILKCKEDESFEKTMSITILKNNEEMNAVDVGDYIAIAYCDEINFLEGNRERFTIFPLSVEVKWNKQENYIYNGVNQSPTASYIDVNGNEISLPLPNLGKEAGAYTAKVESTAAGENYVLTNLTCDYIIEKYPTEVLWQASDFYIENKVLQGPKAFIVGIDGTLIELSVNYSGLNAGENVATINLEEVDDNYLIVGDLNYNYKILQKQFISSGGIILVVILIVLLIALGCFLAWLFYKYFNEKKINQNQREIIIKLNNDFRNTKKKFKRKINLLKQGNKKLFFNIKNLSEQLLQAEKKLALVTFSENLEKVMEKKSKEEKIISSENLKNKAKIKELEEKINTLNEENLKLKSDNIKNLEDNSSRIPIEEYFPEIDKAFQRISTIEFDVDNPYGSYFSQRQQLQIIANILAKYRSQRG